MNQIHRSLDVVLTEFKGVPPTVFHTSPDPWATGSFAALLPEAERLHGIVLPMKVLMENGIEPYRRARTRIGGYLMALPPQDPVSIRAECQD